jgi:hypothetical protein
MQNYSEIGRIVNIIPKQRGQTDIHEEGFGICGAGGRGPLFRAACEKRTRKEKGRAFSDEEIAALAE